MTLIAVSLHDATWAVEPANVTQPSCCLLPKLRPLSVTVVPGTPSRGVMLVMMGGVNGEKYRPFDGRLRLTTPTNPCLVILEGTLNRMRLSLQLTTFAFAPAHVTQLVPALRPKPEPVNATTVPGAPSSATAKTRGGRWRPYQAKRLLPPDRGADGVARRCH